jgi:hypothetical protein
MQLVGGPETAQRGTRISFVFERNLDRLYIFCVGVPRCVLLSRRRGTRV